MTMVVLWSATVLIDTFKQNCQPLCHLFPLCGKTRHSVAKVHRIFYFIFYGISFSCSVTVGLNEKKNTLLCKQPDAAIHRGLHWLPGQVNRRISIGVS